MNKKILYRGFEFIIKVELNTKIDKFDDLNRWHTITIASINKGNYYKKEEIHDNLLEFQIRVEEDIIKQYVDSEISKDTKSYDELRLLSLGFKKNN